MTVCLNCNRFYPESQRYCPRCNTKPKKLRTEHKNRVMKNKKIRERFKK